MSWRPIRLWDVEASIFSRQSAHRWRWGCQPYTPAALYPPRRSLILISVRGWVQPRAIVWLEESEQLKNSTTSSRIEPATFRLVAQCLNQPAYRVPKGKAISGGPPFSRQPAQMAALIKLPKWIFAYQRNYLDTFYIPTELLKIHFANPFTSSWVTRITFSKAVDSWIRRTTHYTVLEMLAGNWRKARDCMMGVCTEQKGSYSHVHGQKFLLRCSLWTDYF
jgi:hypothetical protein